jgi:hypothetical protein
MKKFFVVFLGLIFSLSVLAQEKMNDPNVEKRDVKNFHAIKVSNAFDVYITQGNEEALAVSASESEYRDRIKTSVDNGVLKIWFDNEKKFWKGFSGNRMKLKAYISFKDIDRLDIKGACNVNIVGAIKTDDLNIDLSGASDMHGELDVKNLTVDLSGASDMKVSGTVSKMKIGVSGASDFKGFDLVTDYCEAEASGASGVKITVNKELSARASGASDVGYKGDGVIRNIHTSGASSISKKS